MIFTKTKYNDKKYRHTHTHTYNKKKLPLSHPCSYSRVARRKICAERNKNKDFYSDNLWSIWRIFEQFSLNKLDFSEFIRPLLYCIFLGLFYKIN